MNCQVCGQGVSALEAQVRDLRADKERLEKADRESHDLCCRLAAKIGIERGYSEGLKQALEQIVKRVALVSPYYEMARAALDGMPLPDLPARKEPGK